MIRIHLFIINLMNLKKEKQALEDKVVDDCLRSLSGHYLGQIDEEGAG